MNAEEKIIIQGIKLELAQLNQQISQREIDNERQKLLKELPEWINIDVAASLKGGGSLDTIRTRYYYQPCCGLNYKYVHGRKCWHRDKILEWLYITDEKLWEYAQKYKASIPEKFKEIAA